MNSKIIKFQYAMIFLGIVVCIFFALINKDFAVNNIASDEVVIINDILNSEEDNGVITYEMRLPKGNNCGKSFAYYSYHFQSRIYIDGNEIYSYRKPEKSIIKSSGYKWNYIFLDKDYSESIVRIVFERDFDEEYEIPTVYFGLYKSIVQRLIHDGLINFIIAISIFVIGIILFLYSQFVIDSKTEDSVLRFFAIFAILLGIWSASDSYLSTILWDQPIAFLLITHITLMIMPSAFIMFLHNTYQDYSNFHWGIFCVINNVIVLVRMLLQFLGVSDFKETLWMTHVSIALLVIICVYMSVREIAKIKMTKQMWINVVSVFVILVATSLDLLYYNIYQTSSSFGSFGFLIYIVVMGIFTIRRSKKLMERARENEVYRKLAFTDELTGLFNRTAFQRDFENHDKGDDKVGREKVSILMFDLNDLKKCNDQFGHNYGDEYIEKVAKVIKEIFGLDGRCYRIGGDEFCVILQSLTSNDIKNKIDMFKRKISNLNSSKFVVPISVAVGYAIYDRAKDNNLNDTLNRADKFMYANKELIKTSNG